MDRGGSEKKVADAGHHRELSSTLLRRFFASRCRGHGAERPGRVPGLPPQLQAEIARDDAGADVAAAARNRAARMRGMRIIGLAIVAATAFGVWSASTVAQSRVGKAAVLAASAPISPHVLMWH